MLNTLWQRSVPVNIHVQLTGRHVSERLLRRTRGFAVLRQWQSPAAPVAAVSNVACPAAQSTSVAAVSAQPDLRRQLPWRLLDLPLRDHRQHAVHQFMVLSAQLEPSQLRVHHDP